MNDGTEKLNGICTHRLGQRDALASAEAMARAVGLLGPFKGDLLRFPDALDKADVADFDGQFGALETHSGSRSTERRGITANPWMVCALAERMLAKSVLHDSLSVGPSLIETIAWPHPLQSSDEVELRIEILERSVAR